MEAAGEAHRQAAAAQGPLQHPDQIEVAEQAEAAGLGKAEAQALQPFTVGRALGPLLGDRRRWDHHVVAQVRTTDPAVAAALKGAIRHHGRRQGPLQVFGQPALVDAGIDVVPGQGLGAEGLQVGLAQGQGCRPFAQLMGPVAPPQAGRLDRPGPGGVGAIRRLKPGIKAGTGPPGGLDHRRQTPVAPADKVLHGREAHIAHVGFDAAQGPQGGPEQGLAPAKFGRADAVPLEGGVGLGREIADREIQLQTAQIGAIALQIAAGFGNAEHVGVGLTGQADHEIELDFAVAVLHRRANAAQQLPIGEPLVNDVAQALAAGLRRKGEAGLAGAAEDVGDVLVEAIHPLAGQGEGHVLVGEAIAQLHPDRRQGQVVGAAERKQGKVAVAGALHAGFDRLDHRLRLHIPGRASEHARLAEAAAAGAAAADLHGEPVVHRLDMGHQAHGVVGHGSGGAPQHPLRDPRP